MEVNGNIDYRLIAWSLEWEGYIGISGNKNEFNNRIYKYYPYVCIGNTNKELLEKFKQIVGFGYIDNGTFSSKEKAKGYKWRLRREEIEVYLPKILPYLVYKQRQGELVLEALKILKTKKFILNLGKFQPISEIYSYDEICTLESIYIECFNLNIKITQRLKNNLL
jgi:hypothetical protein